LDNQHCKLKLWSQYGCSLCTHSTVVWAGGTEYSVTFDHTVNVLPSTTLLYKWPECSDLSWPVISERVHIALTLILPHCLWIKRPFLKKELSPRWLSKIFFLIKKCLAKYNSKLFYFMGFFIKKSFSRTFYDYVSVIHVCIQQIFRRTEKAVSFVMALKQ
jgi:hypothetical protein